MLTENEARDLLHLAGATVDVPPGAPVTIAAKRPPRWPVVAAAAAVVAVVATSVALAQRADDPQPVGPLVDIPRVDYRGIQTMLGPDQIPSVFGYDEVGARELLAGFGLDVKVSTEPVSCNESGGRAIRTSPAVGRRFAPGDAVTLFVGVTPSAPCPHNPDLDLAWALLDFANGRGPAPEFADDVVVVANGERSTIFDSDAAEATNWVDGTPLGVLRQKSQEVQETRMGWGQMEPHLTPGLGVDPSELGAHCGGYGLSGLDPAEGIQLRVEFPSDGVSLICTSVDVFRTKGQITAILLRTNSLAAKAGATWVPVPHVIDMPIEAARVVLRGVGLQAEYVQKGAPPPLGCVSSEVVATQDPEAGTLAPAGSSVELTMHWIGCADAPGRLLDGTPHQLGMVFLEFAYGGKTFPHFSDTVGLYLGGALKKTLSPTEARELRRWQVAGPYAEATGPFSAIQSVTSGGVANPEIVVGPPRSSGCFHPFTDQPTIPGSVAVTLTNDGQAGPCMDTYAVLLYVDTTGHLSGANLLLGGP